MQFRQFVEIFGSFNYVVPEDKEQQLFDFYMLYNLAGRTSFDAKRQRAFSTQGYDIGTKAFSPEGEQSEEGKIDYMLDEAKQKLLPALKNNLLAAVFFGITTEFRFILNSNDNDVARLLNNQELELLKKYSSEYYRSGKEEGVRKASIAAAKAVGDNVTFVALTEKLFNKAPWSEGYGGPLWGAIAKAWLDLYRAKTYPQLFVQIDHIYDLQHNLGSVLDKNKDYLKDGSLDWLKNALSLKANIKNPYEIIDKISPNLKGLAIRAIKMKTGQSREQFSTTPNLIRGQTTMPAQPQNF